MYMYICIYIDSVGSSPTDNQMVVTVGFHQWENPPFLQDPNHLVRAHFAIVATTINPNVKLQFFFTKLAPNFVGLEWLLGVFTKGLISQKYLCRDTFQMPTAKQSWPVSMYHTRWCPSCVYWFINHSNSRENYHKPKLN